MPSATLRAVHGLNTAPNPFSEVPEGALLIADEVVAREAGVLSSRRGMKPSVSFASDCCFSLPTTAKMLCTSIGNPDPVLYDPDLDTATTLSRSAGLDTQLGVRTPYGTDARMKIQGAAARGNLYFTTSEGLAVVPGLSSPQWRSAGLPRPFFTLNLSTSGTLTMATALRRTYRVTVAMYDELGNFIEGPPSEPVYIDNTSGANRTPMVAISVPLALPQTAFYRVWRAQEVPNGTIASDEMFLVAIANPSGGTGPNGFAAYGTVTVQDTSIDSMLTIPLYTNPRTGDGSGGIAAANVAPPAAGAVAWFKGRMYYGRATFRQSLTLQVIGTGAGGLQSGDQLTIGPLTLTAGTDFAVSTTPGQVAQNVEATARAIVTAFNQAFAGQTSKFAALASLPITRQLRAQYISLGGTDFGRFQVERIFPAPLVDDAGIPFSAGSLKFGPSFAAVGLNVLAHSTDGSSWIGTTDALQWLGVAWNGSLFVAVGSGALTSPDGIDWTVRSTPNGYFAVAWNGTVFAGVGASVVGTSPDGITWTARTIPAGTYYAIAWNGTVFVAIGSGVAATSPDGITWTSRTVPAVTYQGIAWNGTVFLAVGQGGGFATSPDGITWTTRASPTGNYYGVAWNGTTFAAVGVNVAATSPDGITWTARVIPAGTYYGLAWNSGAFAAVGINVAATSPDGITWTARSIPAGTYQAIASTGVNGTGISYPLGVSTSTDSYAPGGVSWSKVGQPEAVPPINYQTVGDPTAAVLGFSIHRDTMFMWKEDGVWAVEDNGGPQPTFSLLDPTAITLAPASVAVLDNIAYALTARGVLQVSQQGTIPVSEPIRPDVVKALNLSPNALAQAFGVGYDSERLYILGLGGYQYVLRVPDAGYPPSPPQWTRWLLQGATHGLVIPNAVGPSSNRLAFVYAAQPPGGNLLSAPTQGAYVERKGGVASMDFVDFIGSIANPATATTNTLTFAQDVHGEIQSGDLFTYNPGGIGTKIYTMRVLSVSKAVVTLDGSYPFTAGGTLSYYRAIRAHWRYTPITGGEPTSEKTWDSLQLHFDYIDGDWVQVSLDSNTSQFRPFSIVPTDPQVSNLGGTVLTSSPLPYPSTLPGPSSPAADVATIPWLRQTRDVVLRVDPGQAEARAARLGVEVVHAQALASFRLTALAASAEEIKGRATR